MDNKIVIFNQGKVTIIHTDDVTKYKGMANCLINPEIPRRVPPHLWTLKDGKIQTGFTENIIAPQSSSKLNLWYFIPFVLGVIVGLLLR